MLSQALELNRLIQRTSDELTALAEAPEEDEEEEEVEA